MEKTNLECNVVFKEAEVEGEKFVKIKNLKKQEEFFLGKFYQPKANGNNKDKGGVE